MAATVHGPKTNEGPERYRVDHENGHDIGKRLYVRGGEGYIHVLDAQAPSAVTRLARVKTADGARTSLFVPDQERVYLAVPHRGAQHAEIRVYEIRD
jgi:hypothetical protein